jgi:NADPH:quinone reductase-like Zn-dependent oxidoreductase
MKAIVLKQAGGIENLDIREVAVPAIADNEVLVRNRSLSINPVDVQVRKVEDSLKNIVQPKAGEDIILGWDLSGVVEATGKAVTRFKAGDEVFGMANFPGHGKAYAVYTAVPENHLALKPANISHESAAAATLAALTAWQALVTYGKIKKGDKVLIHSAAGGVGHYAVQIAKHFGAYVIGSSSAAKKDAVLGYGADEHIDYHQQAFDELVHDADIVVDTIPEPGHLERSLKTLKEGGCLISLRSFPDEELKRAAADKRVDLQRILVTSNGEDMESLAALLGAEELKSDVSAAYRFEEMGKAHEQVATGRTRGKVVVNVN